MPSGDVRRQISLRFWSGLAFSVLSGSVFGACCSLAINYALVEVSLSPLFAVAFGVLFLATGAGLSGVRTGIAKLMREGGKSVHLF